MFAPERVNVPLPVFVKMAPEFALLPLITPAKVVELPSPTVKLPAFVK